MNDHIRVGYWRLKKDRYLAFKRASPAEQPRELIDRTSMSAPRLAQPPRN